MTGPEHYREAERLLGTALQIPVPTIYLDAAQVHATLALAAATALYAAGTGPGSTARAGWRDVTA